MLIAPAQGIARVVANFQTHLVGAAALSLGASLWLAHRGQIDIPFALTCAGLGTFGGLMPDLDAENSWPSRIVWNSFALSSTATVIFALWDCIPLHHTLIVSVLSFLGVRFLASALMFRFSRHRGVIHSLPAAVASGLAVTLVAKHFLDFRSLEAWLCGGFLCFGFLIHLLLDELFSVDILGLRIKRSFGTAIKLGDAQNPIGTIILYLSIAASLAFVPSLYGLPRLLRQAIAPVLF